MKHVTFYCVNHPNLRWSAKVIACTPSGRYNGFRSIFFFGDEHGKACQECSCPESNYRALPTDENRQTVMEEHGRVDF